MNKHLPLHLSAAFFVLITFSSWVQSQDSQSLAVIVNSNSSVHNLSLGDLRKILLAERTYWSGSRKIVLLLPREGSWERGVLLRMLKIDEPGFKKLWLNKQFAGQVDGPPASLPASGTAITMVSAVPDAIAFVPASEVRGSVKVVTIDGHSPTDSPYPVR